jgi:HAMP domain-containing protein
MSKRENPVADTLLAAAIAIGGICVVAMMVPAGSASSAAVASAASVEAGYLPAQVVNQAKEIEPLPPTF